ncbi:MAG: PKD domain-containing protein [Vicinamibacterales bacterium]|nr:PKD domain-containing protein [Vicinamibacterales bacterium]MDP7692928.1 PKD domain-containing protein [Vicinamibacterales bacterium]
MATPTIDGRRGPRSLAFWARAALLTAMFAAATLSGCQQDATPDPFVGPSELGLSLTLSASPDVLPLDGASQSLVTIFARDGSSQPIPNVSLRLQTRFGGVLQDLGQLSARTLVTGQDGRALATYTAPLGGQVDGGAQVELLVTPVGDNFASAVPRTLTIRLVPSGFVTPPATFSAGFRFTPTSPTEFESVLFSTTCLSENDVDCVRDPAAQVVSYAWDFDDGSTGSGSTVTHAYSTPSTYTVTLTVLDVFGRAAAAPRSVTVLSGVGPTATFVLSPTGPSLDESVFFNASDSTASAGRSIVSYSWTFGDGRTASGVTVSHDYDVAGTYNVTLTVTDDRGGE